MNKSFLKNRMKAGIIFSLWAVVFSITTHAALYTFTLGSSGSPIGVVSPGSGSGFPLVSIQDLSAQGMLPSISSFELTLTFNDSGALASDGTGIQGQLLLGTGGSSPYVTFNPEATRTSGGNAIYDVVFSGSPGSPGSGFNGSNPNDTWSLLVWDNNSSVGNQLVSWTLDITAVPEPVNVALGIFAGLALLIVGLRRYRMREADSLPK
jgi:hypothetical protein